MSNRHALAIVLILTSMSLLYYGVRYQRFRLIRLMLGVVGLAYGCVLRLNLFIPSR